jgi:hypothetical protein
VKKLIEGMPFYRDKLHEEGVFARFQEILVKVRTYQERKKKRGKKKYWAKKTSFTRLLKKKKKQARSNKAANKPDSELNEFETVRRPIPILSRPPLHRWVSFGTGRAGVD